MALDIGQVEKTSTTARHADVFEEQVVDAGAEKGLDRLVRRVHDGLSLDVEARVQDHLPAGETPGGAQQRVERGVVVLGHGLHAGGAVDVGDRGKRLPVLPADVHGHDHVRELGARGYVEPLVYLVEGYRGGEGTERFALLHHRVDPVAHARVAWIGQDAPGAERAAAELHA